MWCNKKSIDNLILHMYIVLMILIICIKIAGNGLKYLNILIYLLKNILELNHVHYF